MPTELDKVKIRMNMLSDEMTKTERKIDLINTKLMELIQNLKRFEGE